MFHLRLLSCSFAKSSCNWPQIDLRGPRCLLLFDELARVSIEAAMARWRSIVIISGGQPWGRVSNTFNRWHCLQNKKKSRPCMNTCTYINAHTDIKNTTASSCIEHCNFTKFRRTNFNVRYLQWPTVLPTGKIVQACTMREKYQPSQTPDAQWLRVTESFNTPTICQFTGHKPKSEWQW